MTPCTNPVRRGPALKLDIRTALRESHSFAACKPHLVKVYKTPIMSLESAKRELSKHAIHEHSPPGLAKVCKSRDDLQHSGDAGHHDYLHWALHHPGKRPRHRFELCGCENAIYEIGSDESEPLTEEELAQRRYSTQEALADLEDYVSPLTADIRIDEEVEGDLVETMDASIGLDLTHGSIDLHNAAYVTGDRQQLEADNGTTNESRTIYPSIPFDSDVSSSIRPNLRDGPNHGRRLNPGAFTFQMPSNSIDNNRNAFLRGGGWNGSDSETASSSSWRRIIPVPFWKWWVMWIVLSWFLVAFIALMILASVFLSKGMLHLGKARPCTLGQREREL
ncbi:hypothetical protein CH63R_06898 [Colletotrichum higginsianum IMI 349063]|uniref:Uncharacterized protein n=1 Tax=Colletotrichum higginsianum (strain IMI 349063) TaxID=759273 RepID=A0A1B7YGM5_COLHI|nr:hypothetical protein CH63R_06898 [Colletotrichum higginsianum IMI 349063]OBR11206.1 hypothetical protein CH63R_06898 [Colletotrichum higginsianum IMI 349063]